jgi:hypothetical protein
MHLTGGQPPAKQADEALSPGPVGHNGHFLQQKQGFEIFQRSKESLGEPSAERPRFNPRHYWSPWMAS